MKQLRDLVAGRLTVATFVANVVLVGVGVSIVAILEYLQPYAPIWFYVPRITVFTAVLGFEFYFWSKVAGKGRFVRGARLILAGFGQMVSCLVIAEGVIFGGLAVMAALLSDHPKDPPIVITIPAEQAVRWAGPMLLLIGVAFWLVCWRELGGVRRLFFRISAIQHGFRAYRERMEQHELTL